MTETTTSPGRPLSRREFLRGTALGAAAGLALYGRFVEPWWIQITRTEVAIPQLPPAFDGYRIVQLSDLHHGRMMPGSVIDEAVRHCNELRADLVVVTGDHLGGAPKYAWDLAARLSKLKARDGTLSVLGNHDFGVFSKSHTTRRPGIESEVVRAFESHGLPVLRNEIQEVFRDGLSLPIVGLDDLWSTGYRERPLDSLPESSPRIILAHNPDTLLAIGERRTDLLLCGHTHGGQVALPFVGPLILPTELNYAAGLYPLARGHIYVNRGVGFVWRPIRLMVRPEIACLELRSVTV